MKIASYISSFFLLATTLFAQPSFLVGADCSFLLQVEDNGGVYTENGIETDLFELLSNHGVNCIRLRLWHTPDDGYSNLEKTLQLAQRIKAHGMEFMLDFHYSDWWADPGTQTIPDAWDELNFITLTDSVYQYTTQVISALADQGALPDYVQIGNEIICGMLWDFGRVCDPFNTPQQWGRLAALIGSASTAIDDVTTPADSVRTIIHIDRGGDNGSARWFYDELLEENIEFDIIGLSFYPWWHGDFGDLEYNLNDLAEQYEKDIMVVETAYPWTLDWADGTNNIVGLPSHLMDGYPATVAGQQAYLEDLIDIVQNVSGGHGIGIAYWEPDWITTPTFGSAWENVALFDFEGELLASIAAFENLSTIRYPQEQNAAIWLTSTPNPFNATTVIRYNLAELGEVSLRVFDSTGRLVTTLISSQRQPADEYEVHWDGTNQSGRQVASGIYFSRLTIIAPLSSAAVADVITEKLILTR